MSDNGWLHCFVNNVWLTRPGWISFSIFESIILTYSTIKLQQPFKYIIIKKWKTDIRI